MAIPFMNLPTPGQGVSSLLDFAPLAGALHGYRKGADQAQQHQNMTQIGQTVAGQGLGAGANQALEMGELDAGIKMKSAATDEEDMKKKRFAGMAHAVALEQDPSRQSVMWQGVLKRLGDTSGLTPEELDPVTGPKLMMAEAGIVVDPLEREASQARLGLIRAQTNAANQRTQKAPETREFVDEKNQKYVAQWNGSTWDRIGNASTQDLTIGQEALDKKFAGIYAEDISGGKLEDAISQLGTLESIAAKLVKPGAPNVTGPLLGVVPEGVRAWTNQESVDTQNQIANIVQRSLRPILGAQFTEKEGENLIKRAYNPQLSEKRNAARLVKLAKVTRKIAQQKLKAAKYFEEKGTLKGFEGASNFSISEIEDAIESPDDQGAGLDPPAPAKASGKVRYIGPAD